MTRRPPPRHEVTPSSGRVLDDPWRRTLAGLLSLVSLFAAAAGAQMTAEWAAIALRVGLALGALWLAWPELQRLPRWVGLTALATLAASVVFVRKPQLLLLVVAVMLLAMWLRPRPR